MSKKRGFGKGSFKNNQDIRAVQNLLKKGKISEAEVILLALKDR